MIEKMIIDSRYHNKGIHDVFYYEQDVPVRPKLFKKESKMEQLRFLVLRFSSDNRKNISFVENKDIYKKLLNAMIVSENLHNNLPEKMLDEYETNCYNLYDEFTRIPRWMTDESRIVFCINPINDLKEALRNYTSGHLCKEISPLQVYTPECFYTIDETDNFEPLVYDEQPATNEEYVDIGVGTVDYALKWLEPKGVVSVPKDCTWRNSKCIRINNPDYIDDPQEFDHIVILSGCVIMIETKNYKGKIHIDKYGNWSRELDGEVKGLRNPKQQIERHVDLLKSIIGNRATVLGILCLSHPEVLITGDENTDVTIVRSDVLSDYIATVKDNYCDVIDSYETKMELLELINSYKINNETKVIQ